MKKIIISFTLVIMVVLSPLMIVSAESNVSGHVDHPGSENCIYSCILDNAVTVIPEPNIDYLSEEFLTILREQQDLFYEESQEYLEELQIIIDKYKDMPNNDERAKMFLAELIGVSIDDIDFDSIINSIDYVLE